MKSSTTTALVILLATSTTSVYADVEQQQPKQGQPHDFESANIEYIQQHFNERTAAAMKDKKSAAATFAADTDETKVGVDNIDNTDSTFKSDISSSISQEHALPTREFSSTESFENKKVADVSFNDFANYYWDTLQKHMEEVKEDITAVGGEHLLTSNQGFDDDSLDDEYSNSQDENQGVDEDSSSPEDIVDEKSVDDNTKVADISFNDFNKYYWKNIEERMQQVDESSSDTDEQEEDEAKPVDVKAISSSRVRRNLRGIGDGSTSTMMYNKSKSDYIIPKSRGDDYMIPQLRAKLEE